MLEKIFEKVQSELLTDEVKLEISTLYEAKLNEAIKKKEEEVEKDKEDEIDDIKKDVEEKLEDLKDKVKESLSKFKSKLVKQVENYLSYSTDELIKENRTQIVAQTEVLEAEKIIEAFKQNNIKFGLKLGKILEGVEIKENSQINKYVEKYNNVKNELETLKEKTFKIAKNSLIKEEVEKMNISEIAREKIFDIMSGMRFGNTKEITDKAKVLEKLVKKENEGLNTNKRNMLEEKILKENKKLISSGELDVYNDTSLL